MKEYGFKDANAALAIAKKAKAASEKVSELTAYIGKKSQEIGGLTDTFSVNTQVVNRLDELKVHLDEIVEPLATVAKDIEITAQRSIEAEEVSKNARI